MATPVKQPVALVENRTPHSLIFYCPAVGIGRRPTSPAR
jgi:hypothetical protein